VRTCVDCDEIIGPGESLCMLCKRERNRYRDSIRGTARERGYDAEHDRTRAELLPLAIGQPCPRCGELMEDGQALDLGHSIPRSIDPASRADRIEHATCNRGAGARY
jgi:hypothetical protein